MCNPDDFDPRRTNYDIGLHENSESSEDLASTILSTIKASSCEAFHTATEVRIVKDTTVMTTKIASKQLIVMIV